MTCLVQKLGRLAVLGSAAIVLLGKPLPTAAEINLNPWFYPNWKSGHPAAATNPDDPPPQMSDAGSDNAAPVSQPCADPPRLRFRKRRPASRRFTMAARRRPIKSMLRPTSRAHRDQPAAATVRTPDRRSKAGHGCRRSRGTLELQRELRPLHQLNHRQAKMVTAASTVCKHRECRWATRSR